jgi:toxin ParE1/3/4
LSRILRFSAPAEIDLMEIARRIAADNQDRAVTYILELRERCVAIDERPEAYRLREQYGKGVRVVPHGRYLIFYSSRDSAVVVERIIHGARHLEGLRLRSGD